MLTNNKTILARMESLEKQLQEIKSEIEDRIENKKIDNDGYVIFKSSNGNLMLVDGDFLNQFNDKWNAKTKKEMM